MDKQGRIVIPQAVRERLGLEAGGELELTETPDGLILRPRPRRSALVSRDGSLVFTCEVPAGFDTVKAIKEDRENRMRGIWGN